MVLRGALPLLPLLASPAAAWNDIAGALTYKGTSHVFQVNRAPPHRSLARVRRLLPRFCSGPG
jgi:hypothetical protein